MTATKESFGGSEIYVDANMFLFVALAHPRYAARCVAFLNRARSGQFSLVTCSLTLDEFLLVALAERLEQVHGVSRGKMQFLRGHPEVVRGLTPYVNTLVEDITTLATIEWVRDSDAEEMGRLIEAYGLLPRDALHVAVMKRLGLTAIATDDADFERVSGIQVFVQ